MHEDVGRCVGTATRGLVQPEHLQATRNREKKNRRRVEQPKIAMHEADGLEGCCKCHFGVSTSQILEQSAECRFRRTLVVVHLALLFRNLACEQAKFRGRSRDCVLHEQIVILSLPAKCYQKNKGLVLTSRRCIENTEPVLSNSRLSLDCRLFVVQLP